MTALAAAIDTLFADPHLAQKATYTPADGAPVPVRVIERRPDVVSEFAGGRIASATAVFDLRVSEVAAPRPGDRIELDGEAFLVQGEPRRDAARLVWTLDTRPA
jgi:hypothetical protein